MQWVLDKDLDPSSYYAYCPSSTSEPVGTTYSVVWKEWFGGAWQAPTVVVAADMEHGGAPGLALASDVWAEHAAPLVGHSTVALRFGVESDNAEEEAWFDHFQVIGVGPERSAELCGAGDCLPGSLRTGYAAGMSGADPVILCEACEPGQADTDQDAATPCVDCEVGKFSGTLGATNCFTCVAGSTSALGAAECIQCIAGKYGTMQESVSTCSNCPMGRFSDAVGSSECVGLCHQATPWSLPGSIVASACIMTVCSTPTDTTGYANIVETELDFMSTFTVTAECATELGYTVGTAVVSPCAQPGPYALSGCSKFIFSTSSLRAAIGACHAESAAFACPGVEAERGPLEHWDVSAVTNMYQSVPPLPILAHARTRIWTTHGLYLSGGCVRSMGWSAMLVCGHDGWCGMASAAQCFIKHRLSTATSRRGMLAP
jgi:hypothetical protein